MTNLSQYVTNLHSQFFLIILKILAPHLQDRAKYYLNNVGVKGPKTKYNNEELISKIRRYFLKYI